MARKRHDSRQIQLESGGKVTVEFDFSMFDLSGRDREFVTYLIDMIHDFEAATKAEVKSGRPKSGADRPAPRSATAPTTGSSSVDSHGDDAA